jgi:hypothetical protein
MGPSGYRIENNYRQVIATRLGCSLARGDDAVPAELAASLRYLFLSVPRG